MEKAKEIERKSHFMFTRRLLLAAMAFTASCLFAQEAALAVAVDDIVNKHVSAMGGADKIKAIRTSKSTGKMIMGGGQMEASMVAYSRRPKATRVEIDLQGQKIVQGFDGATSWMVNPMTGNPEPQKMPADEAKAAADNADPDGSPLIDYKAKGNLVELMGKEDVEGTMAYKLKITLKSGTSSMMFIDQKTFLPCKMITQRKQMGQVLDLEAYPSKYKAVDGVQMPFATEIKVGGKSTMQYLIEKVETNMPLDDKMFAFPVKEPEVKK
jgi:outer membrane lipoprotein-sorting protein